MSDEPATWTGTSRSDTLHLRRCRLEVVGGPDAGKAAEFACSPIVIGRGGSGADFVVEDPRVSSLHCEITLGPLGYRVRDLGSTNGTLVRGVRVLDGFIAPGTTLQLGATAVMFSALADSVELPLWHAAQLGTLVGASAPMRQLFERIVRFAQADATVLIQGETGTGKEGVADAIHRNSPRRAQPFVVLDCSAIPEQLFEDQLFGHERGAFTGAERAAIGVFEAAHRGTVFLDEIGELPLAMQAKLLRVVETRRVRRIGGTATIATDVRIVAATNRDLAAEVNRGTFRADLYYRLSVAKLVAPPLRERREDVPLLVEHFVRELRASDPHAYLPDDFLARVERHAWPGNVRELRNAVERAVLLPDEPRTATTTAPADILDVPFKRAKQQLVDDFERAYLEALMARHGNQVAAMARAAGVERMSIYRMLRRLGLTIEEGDGGDEGGDEDPTPDPLRSPHPSDR